MPPSSQSANPLLLAWVKDWWDVAKERNSKGAPVYKHAYESLKACPITFSHPSELSQLKHFGPKLCDRLTVLLEEHCRENGLPAPKRPSRKKRAKPSDVLGDGAGDEDDEQPKPAKKPRTKKQYVPAYRSGAYALIVALSQQDPNTAVGLTKGDLIEVAQEHCDASFTVPKDATSFYTAWASMKTLETKELVYQRGKPLKRYALTDEGWEVARAIETANVDRNGNSRQPITQARDGDDDDDDVLEVSNTRLQAHQPSLEPELPPAATQRQEFANVVSDGPATASEGSAIPNFTPIRLPPGSFTVELVLDVREVRTKTDRDYIKEELAKKGTTPIMRSLDLGDALWVAKCNDPSVLSLLPRHGTQQDGEVVLDYIVERKRLDDLINSIKDGRFHEQKFRLRRSGVKNVIYLLEEISMDSNVFSKYEEAMSSAIASTQVVNGYFLKKTITTDDTVRYLNRMTMLLKKRYEGKTLHVIPTGVLTAQNYNPLLTHLREKPGTPDHYITYPAFASLCSKSDMMTLRDVYLKMLMCTKGVTGEKAVEMQKRWKTPYDFVKAFEQCGSGAEGKRKQGEMVSSRMATLVPRRKIGVALSKNIAEIWGDMN